MTCRITNILGKRDKAEMKAIESLPYDEDGNLATEQGPLCGDEYTHDIYRNYYNTDTLLLSGVTFSSDTPHSSCQSGRGGCAESKGFLLCVVWPLPHAAATSSRGVPRVAPEAIKRGRDRRIVDARGSRNAQAKDGWQDKFMTMLPL